MLAAALKAREQAEQAERLAMQLDSGDHLVNINQPKTEYENDDDSIVSMELFDAPKGPPPAKMLLVTALKARPRRQ